MLLFPLGALYFREKPRCDVIQNSTSKESYKKLLFALERARTRLAVTMAAESKSTPLDRWQYYLDTADRIRKFIKKLRKEDLDESRNQRDWELALQKLNTISMHDTALRLSRILSKIVAELE
jgi:chromatin segregation and condensation protein Rec8/ScpA/Scc1 (kleisin family)